MEPTISKTENSISELEVDMENDGIENNTLDATTEYNEYGLCPECNKPNTGRRWCNQCNAKRVQQDFPNWTGGNKYVDNFIQESQLNAKWNGEVLEWIPYNRLTNIKYLAKGGFSTVYKATWLDGWITGWDHDKKQWKRYPYDNKGYPVGIKSLNNSSNINDEFLNEWKFHFNCYKKASGKVVRLFGFTQDPNNLDYMIVMVYAEDGSLRNSLKNNLNSWYNILMYLNHIITGLCAIHESKLVHCDLHDGNILCYGGMSVNVISDLGLSKPIEYFQNKSESVYGVIPYMAPEVLRGKPYTPATDIYSFAMIMWELISGVPPFDDRAHDFHLSLSICKGERPEIIEGIPQCYIDLMKKCWDLDPLQRPSASELKIIFENWYDKFCEIYDEDEDEVRNHLETIEDEQLRKDMEEFWEADKALEEKQNNNSETSNSKPITKSHPHAYHTSRLLGFTKQLNIILEQEEKEIYGYKGDVKVESYETGISQSIDALNLTEEDINEALKDAENETQPDKDN